MTHKPDLADHQLWYTRCPVPTASGLAYQLGWLNQELGQGGYALSILQDAPRHISQHHFDHGLEGLIREGGNVPAIVARADGVPTRVIGLTWIEERQTILVAGSSPIAGVGDLRGARVAVPGWGPTRDASHSRGMALHGFHSALALAGFTLDDVAWVDVPVGDVEAPPTGKAEARAWRWPELALLAAGEVDAVYAKGGNAVEAAEEIGARVLVNLDELPDRRSRVNNGTPRPITVHQALLDQDPDIAVRFLARTLEAGRWAEGDRAGAAELLGRDTASGPRAVDVAYGPDFHLHLAPDLTDELVALLGQQKDFLGRHGFLAADFDVRDWIDPEPLRAARLAQPTTPDQRERTVA